MSDFTRQARQAAMLATGQMGWRPIEFWEATPAELMLALEGRLGPASAPLARGELDRLKERLGDG